MCLLNERPGVFLHVSPIRPESTSRFHQTSVRELSNLHTRGLVAQQRRGARPAPRVTSE